MTNICKNHLYPSLQVLLWMNSRRALDWHSSPGVAFPKVTMCDLSIRRMGNLHRYTVQCSLPINMYNEMIYTFLWFWMVFVAVVTAISFITWLLRACMRQDRIRYVQNHLRLAVRLKTNDDVRASEKFVKSYLRPDGVFILRLIGHNTNHLTVTEIVAHLWDKWERRPVVTPTRSIEPPNPSAPDHHELQPLKEKYN